MSKIIIANWKMKLSVKASLDLAKKLNSALDTKNKIVICPDFISLALISALKFKKNFILGAQDSAISISDALTGEVSALSLKEIGVSYVILGHSERRLYQKEDDQTINQKIKIALANNLKIVLCLGENKQEYQTKKTKEVIKNQLKKALSGIILNKNSEIIIAYEPIWAIGTGLAMQAVEANVIAEYIKKIAMMIIKKPVKVLYGGSVDSSNAQLFLKQKNLQGLLVGGASLKIEEFLKISNN